jgi:NAD(P)-dependent dehydrogenase (short-subunit alcohol dehydrogenase family)
MSVLAGKVALVLGGGAIRPGIGIGRAICIAYATEGAIVIVADRDLDSAQQTADLCTGASAVAVDVLDDAALSALVGKVARDHGRLDILYCNVGLGQAGPSGETTPSAWRCIADANLTALHVATQAAVAPMRAGGGGVVLITSSIAGIRDVGYPHLAYGATKAAAIQFARLFAMEYAQDNIRANTIVAGLIDTPRIEATLAKSYGDWDLTKMKAARASQVPIGRMGSAQDIADAAVFLASDRASYITGTELIVDGGLSNTTRQPLIKD